jgi:hypothetical protein
MAGSAMSYLPLCVQLTAAIDIRRMHARAHRLWRKKKNKRSARKGTNDRKHGQQQAVAVTGGGGGCSNGAAVSYRFQTANSCANESWYRSARW